MVPPRISKSELNLPCQVIDLAAHPQRVIMPKFGKIFDAETLSPASSSFAKEWTHILKFRHSSHRFQTHQRTKCFGQNAVRRLSSMTFGHIRFLHRLHWYPDFGRGTQTVVCASPLRIVCSSSLSPLLRPFRHRVPPPPSRSKTKQIGHKRTRQAISPLSEPCRLAE